MRHADSIADRGRAIGTAIALSLGGPLLGVILLNIAALGIVATGYELDPSGPASILLSLVFVTLLGFGGLSVLYLRARGLGLEFVPVDIPDLRDLIWTVAGYVLALVGVFALAIIFTAVVGTPEASNRASEIAMANPDLYLLLIPASFLVIAPGEELLFRGIIQGRLREAFSAPSAIAIASALFAIIHFAALTGAAMDRLQVLVILFVPAIALGVAYEKSKNLVVPVLVHGAFDATVFSLQYLVVRYAPEQLDQASAFLV